jgi:hypothetical protein
MPNHKQTKSTAARALALPQYRQECIRRHPDFKQDWESFQFTVAVMAERLKGLRDMDSPRTAESAAALASTKELLEAGMRKKWPHLFKKPAHHIPLYPDTTEDEWLAIFRRYKDRERLQQQRDQLFSATPQPDQSPKKRTHKDELAFRLQVYDSHQELKNFTQVGQRLRHAESNVRRAYNKVWFDIFGAPLPRRTKERRAAGFNPSSHMDTCSICQAATTFKDMCQQTQAFTDKDVRASRELLLN